MTRNRIIASLVAILGVFLATGGAAQAASPWKVIPSPNQGSKNNSLSAVAALSASNAWAVGLGDPGPLIEHWNGSKWSIVPANVKGGEDLQAISAPSATDIWADGFTSVGNILIEHYNGSRWSKVAAPPGMDAVNGISAISATDVWVTAETFSNTGVTNGYLDHWDGTAWTPHQFDHAGRNDGLGAGSLVAFGPSNAWVIDTHFGVDSATWYAKHWNGTKFLHEAGPTPSDPSDDELLGIGANSPSDVWIVGTWDNDQTAVNPVFGPLAGYWNGSGWVTPTLPNAYPVCCHSFQAVAPVTPNNVWAVGQRFNATSTTENLLEHWNGTTWTEWGGPNPDSDAFLNGVAAIPGTSGAWAVGQSGDPWKTTILRCC